MPACASTACRGEGSWKGAYMVSYSTPALLLLDWRNSAILLVKSSIRSRPNLTFPSVVRSVNSELALELEIYCANRIVRIERGTGIKPRSCVCFQDSISLWITRKLDSCEIGRGSRLCTWSPGFALDTSYVPTWIVQLYTRNQGKLNASSGGVEDLCESSWKRSVVNRSSVATRLKWFHLLSQRGSHCCEPQMSTYVCKSSKYKCWIRILRWR